MIIKCGNIKIYIITLRYGIEVWSGGAMMLGNFQCRGVLLIWIIVGQGPTALAAGADGGCLDMFSLVCHFSLLSSPLWEAARYRLKNCLKGPLSPNQPTNQIDGCHNTLAYRREILLVTNVESAKLVPELNGSSVLLTYVGIIRPRIIAIPNMAMFREDDRDMV